MQYATMIPRYSGIINADEYSEPDQPPAVTYSDHDGDDTEDTAEESSPVLVSSRLLAYAHPRPARHLDGPARPKAITSLDDLYKASYEHTHKIYTRPGHLPAPSLSMQQQQLHDRVNARLSAGVTRTLGTPATRRPDTRRDDDHHRATGQALTSRMALPSPASSYASLSRTPSLSASSSASCESLASSAASQASSPPALISRSNSYFRVRRSGSVASSTDSCLTPPSSGIFAKPARKPSISRIPTTTTTTTIASSNVDDAEPAVASSPSTHHAQDAISSDNEASTMAAPSPASPDEVDHAQQLLTSIRTRHDRLLGMLDNIRHRMSQVRQSWEEDEDNRQQYIARLRHSVMLDHDLANIAPIATTTTTTTTMHRGSRRSSLPAPALPVKSLQRRPILVSPTTAKTMSPSHGSSTEQQHQQQQYHRAAISTPLSPIVEAPSPAGLVSRRDVESRRRSMLATPPSTSSFIARPRPRRV
ncbi:hypothetical protein SYNPS1DRAFT_31516 [Syncephalis pseudoplumigaleata]|uniref:Uncharacterized protein n=1 Tax=Syncephalis pseudoplumigaleata TaxID=1712513 RepID=A0A4P9YSE3_9FUNG|nr:hypothetical protein SYNPS1DRAFT_31516 [Syncephalis pseudoplumigaleata]|eukprot:RKP22826.1 hypothetical protein SYNPS1DRAFT_31516 [Syncephalis pseudoplumigaleata]